MLRDFLLHRKSVKECLLNPTGGEPIPPPLVTPVTWGALNSKAIAWNELNTKSITWGDLTKGVEI